MISRFEKLSLVLLASVWTAVANGQSAQMPAGAEADALDLADKVQDSPKEPVRPLRAFVELAFGQGSDALTGAAGMGRAAFDLRYSDKLTPQVSAVLSARFDMVRGRGSVAEGDSNTWREAYLSWAVGSEYTIDLGRRNVRHGVAFGFNPTDWFKQSSVRTVLNLDPAVLRENRQGTVVLQGHRLWDSASLSMAFSPKLTSGGNDAVFSPRFGATNPEDRWLVAGSFRLLEGLSPQILLFGGSSTSTQVGANVTALVSDAMVVHAEYSIGQGLTLVGSAQSTGQTRERLDRLATGFTYTTPFDLTLTAEWQYNGAAPTKAQWQGMDAAARGALLNIATDLQDLPARRQLFFYAQWKPPAMRGVELNGFLQRDLETSGNSGWVEARYRLKQTDLALQFQAFGGSAGSIYKTMPQQKAWQLIWRHYL